MQMRGYAHVAIGSGGVPSLSHHFFFFFFSAFNR